ncbi:pupal cuticle protein G1A-like [Hetaerina americana]|uniref:pupal cuticle protein G1A-like n=1 Tax=Hetaerina americana TaxID=62018 RepID=UPI003A7F4D73
MAFKVVILAALVAVANAGFLGAPAAYGYAAPSVAVATPTITSQSQNTLRSYGNLGQVSTYTKSIDTPFSSVRKSDVRVSNDALAYAPAAYHAPAVAAYAAPAVAAYHAPAVATYAAPAVAAYHAPAAVAAPVVAKAGLLGVAYSAAPAVTHLSFDGYGVHYGLNDNTSPTMYKFVVLAALVAVANAGFLGAPAAYGYAAAPVAVHAPAIGSSHQSTVRSLDGNHAISHYSKAVDSAFSSVRKTDTRISNDAVGVAYAAAPAIAAYHAPAVAAYHAPAVATYAAPAVVKTAYAAPAIAAYHAPAAVAAPVVAKAGLLGVAYSAAPAVAHLSFDGYGVHYGY